MNKEQKFYESTWFAIAMFIIVCPLGVYLMWKNNKFNKLIRVVVSIIAIPVTILGIMFWYLIFSDDPSVISRKERNEVESSQLEKEVAEEETENKEKEEIPKEEYGNNKKSKEPKTSETIEPFINMCTNSREVYFEELMRNPDKYKEGTYIVKGVINQVMDLDDGTIQIKIYDEITEDEMILIYYREDGQQRFLENDYIFSIIDFIGIQSIEMVSGEHKPFPIGEVENIELGSVAQAMIVTNDAINKLGYNYKLIYDGSTYIGQGIGDTCYLFKVYDLDSKEYKTEVLASYEYNVYWYNKDTFELSNQIIN